MPAFTEQEALNLWAERAVASGQLTPEEASVARGGEITPYEIVTGAAVHYPAGTEIMVSGAAVQAESMSQYLPELPSAPPPSAPPPQGIIYTGGASMSMIFDGTGELPPSTTIETGGGSYPAIPVNMVSAVQGVIPFILAAVASGKLDDAVRLAKSWLGRSWLKWLLAAVGAGLLGYGIYNLLKSKGKRKSRRYSIGANPRLNTLLKVAKRVDNIFVAYNRRVGKYRTRTRTPRLPAHAHVVRNR